MGRAGRLSPERGQSARQLGLAPLLLLPRPPRLSTADHAAGGEGR